MDDEQEKKRQESIKAFKKLEREFNKKIKDCDPFYANSCKWKKLEREFNKKIKDHKHSDNEVK